RLQEASRRAARPEGIGVVSGLARREGPREREGRRPRVDRLLAGARAANGGAARRAEARGEEVLEASEGNYCFWAVPSKPPPRARCRFTRCTRRSVCTRSSAVRAACSARLCCCTARRSPAPTRKRTFASSSARPL